MSDEGKTVEQLAEQLKTLTNIREIRSELKGLSSEELKQLRNIEGVSGKIKEAIAVQLDLQTKIADKLSSTNKRLSELYKTQQTLNTALAFMRDAYDEQIGQMDTLFGKQQLRQTMFEMEEEFAKNALEQRDKERKLIQEELKDLSEKLETNKDDLETAEKIRKEMDGLRVRLQTTVGEAKEYNKQLKISKANIEAATGGINQMEGATKAVANAALSKFGLLNDQGDILTNVMISVGRDGFGAIPDLIKASLSELRGINAAAAALNKSIFSIVNQMFELAHATDAAESSFRRTFGMGIYKDTDKQIRVLADEMVHLGVDAGELGASFQALSSTVTDFSHMTTEQQTSLARTTALLGEYGVEADKTSALFQQSIKVLGNSTKETEQLGLSMNAFAQDLGVSAGELIGQLGQMTPQLAKVSDVESSFKDLARVAKSTGLEMTKILQITDKFDTFEGAADQVGRLNALLGGDFVNAIDLMMMESPADRFNTIADSIKNAGLSFESMSYFQKLAYTEAMGLSDVGELALVLSGNSDMLAESTSKTSAEYEAQAKAALALTSVQEDLKIIFATMAQQGGPIDTFLTYAKGLAEWARDHPDLLKAVVSGLIALRGALALKTLLTQVTSLFGIFGGTATKAAESATEGVVKAGENIAEGVGSMAESLSESAATVGENLSEGIGNGIERIGESLQRFGRSVRAHTTTILQMAGAIALVTLSFAVLVLATAELAKAFAKLDGGQMTGLIVTLALLGGAIVLFGYLLIANAPAVGAAAGALLALGAAALMAGAGVALIGAGVMMMASAFTMVMDAIDPAKVTLMMSFLASLAGASIFLLPIAGLFYTMSVGLAAMAAAMFFMDGDKIANFASLMTAMTNIPEIEKLTALADSIREIADAIDSIPEEKALALTSTINSTVVASRAITTTASAQLAGNISMAAVAASGGGTGGGGTTRTVKRQDVFVNFNIGETVFRKKVITIVGEAFDLEQD